MTGKAPQEQRDWTVQELDTKLEYPIGKREQARHKSPTPQEYDEYKRMIDKRPELKKAAIQVINQGNKARKEGEPFVQPTASQTLASFPNKDKVTLGISRHEKGGRGTNDFHSEDDVARKETKDRASARVVTNPRLKREEPKTYARKLVNSLLPCNDCEKGVLKSKLVPADQDSKIAVLSDEYRRNNRKHSPTGLVDGFTNARHASNERRRREKEKDDELDQQADAALEALGGRWSRSPSPAAPARQQSPHSRAREEHDRRFAEYLQNQPPSSGEEEEEAEVDDRGEGSSNPVLRRQQQARRRGRK
jgi:hypothetical protein